MKGCRKIKLEKHLIFIICLSFLVSSCGGCTPEQKGEEMSEMEGKIILAPIGALEEWFLDALAKDLEKIFNCKVERYAVVEIPQDAYNPSRKQFFSTRFLRELRNSTSPGKQEKVLGITDVDLYVDGLNFVFGEAELEGLCAVISVARLHQSFYGLPENKTLFLERTIKEAVHELGHVYGLKHCPNPDCVMHFSNSLVDTDRKKVSFCSRCKRLLEKLY